MPDAKFMDLLEGTSNQPPPHKHHLTRQAEMPGFNSSFLTPANMRWFTVAINWMPNPSKPLILLPCGSGNKTRAEYGKKMVSQGTTHQLMSAVTREPSFERVILSEPLTIIPYEIEAHELRPDYNLPPEDLSIQSERIFINQLALWLAKVKLTQPERKFVYYLGPLHHYFILYFANSIVNSPFIIVHEIPEGGSAYDSPAAKHFRDVIFDTERTGVPPAQSVAPFEKVVAARGRNCKRKFWRAVIMEQFINHEFTRSVERVTSREEAMQGFEYLYNKSKKKNKHGKGKKT